ncbi:phosphomannomutase/phosphoglucomutase [Desulfonatronovibrio hydrogenovorans]|uniref:phosphomannomutase/phosphoglucomutase n=1 Tax=Desulfonatronovibrio hydrogenovorans TaxID=53245 RepID=UPI00048B9EFC|nr:phosphomannomutase/phosphoglucomutase [Desulfonatronovibrio hydrogenovorans]
MKKINKEIFRAYDIRGIVDSDFDAEWVELLGRACGTYFRKMGIDQAVVGHDCRHSSPAYQESIVRGLQSTGVDVVFLNMVATPLFYFAVKKLGRRAGVMVTASHNPSDFNGFKIWAGDSTIHSQEIQKVYDIMVKGEFAQGSGLASEVDIEPEYLAYLKDQGPISSPVKVVVDGGNGAAGLVCVQALLNAGAEVIPIYCEPDGNFPNHHPDPTVMKNNADLVAAVIREKAQLGIGLDGDGDRIGVVDEQGRMVYGDQLLAIYAREVLRKNPGACVIGEVKCSHLLFQDIQKHGGRPIMWQTGHSLIKAKMKEENALLAGEMSGHMFFSDRYYGFDDAVYSAQRLVEIVAGKGSEKVSTYLADWPKTFNTPEIRMDCPEKIKFKVVKKAQDYFRNLYKIVDVDGVRITFDDGWALLRASNTQPVLVLRFEAESRERLEELRLLVEEPLKEWINDLT